MKILFLCTFYHQALLFSQQKNALEKRGHEVQVFNSTFYGDEIKEKFKPVMTSDVIHKECYGKADRLFFFPRMIRTEKALYKSLDMKQFDLIHAHLMLGSGIIARDIKKKYSIPYVVSVRETDMSTFIHFPYFREMALKNMEEACGILFLSKHLEKKTLSIYKDEKTRKMIQDKSVVIGNCLEKYYEENRALLPKTLSDKGRLKILCVSKIAKEKNIEMAAKAVKYLNESGHPAILDVIGEVLDERIAGRLKAMEYVHLLPFKKKEELIQLYRNYDLFLLPSKIETFGRVYVEAMSQGLPIIYSKDRGFDGNFPDGSVGYACNPDDEKDIAQCVMKVLNNYDEISANCIRNCECFFEENIMNRIEEFYYSSMKRGRN